MNYNTMNGIEDRTVVAREVTVMNYIGRDNIIIVVEFLAGIMVREI